MKRNVVASAAALDSNSPCQLRHLHCLLLSDTRRWLLRLRGRIPAYCAGPLLRPYGVSHHPALRAGAARRVWLARLAAAPSPRSVVGGPSAGEPHHTRPSIAPRSDQNSKALPKTIRSLVEFLTSIDRTECHDRGCPCLFAIASPPRALNGQPQKRDVKV